MLAVSIEVAREMAANLKEFEQHLADLRPKQARFTTILARSNPELGGLS